MGLKLSEWTVLLCFCAFGIQHSYQNILAEYRDMQMNCARDGGYCINVIPPPPPRRRQNRRRMRTNTRKGQRARRPSPAAVGASHTRLPASARAAGGAAAAPAPSPSAYPAQQQQNSFFNPFFLGGGGGGGTGAGGMTQGVGQSANPMNDFFPFMFMTRKKRQAPAAEPGEAAERPRIMRGEQMFTFLNRHCRKSEFDFGCRNEGGMCCLPHL